jgi:hypothetical protein
VIDEVDEGAINSSIGESPTDLREFFDTQEAGQDDGDLCVLGSSEDLFARAAEEEAPESGLQYPAAATDTSAQL